MPLLSELERVWILCWGAHGEVMGAIWGGPGNLMGIFWGEPGELMGKIWGDPGELMGIIWGGPGELMVTFLLAQSCGEHGPCMEKILKLL